MPHVPGVGHIGDSWDIAPCPSHHSLCALPADPNTLFRSNSLASKSMEQFMKVSTGGDTGHVPTVPSCDGMRAQNQAGFVGTVWGQHW